MERSMDSKNRTESIEKTNGEQFDNSGANEGLSSDSKENYVDEKRSVNQDDLLLLYKSLKERKLDTIKSLVQDKGVDINHVFKESFVELPDRGFSALFFICHKGNVEHFEFLRELGASPGLQNQKLDTPLHLLSKHGYHKCVKYLLEWDDTLKDRQNMQGLTPIMKALYRVDTSFKQLAYEQTIDLLVGAGCDVNLSPNVSPLHLVAGKWGSTKVAKKLIDAGADVNGNSASSSPLMTALCRKKVDINMVTLLINSGADVNYKNPKGKSILHIAVSKSEDICVENLLKAGADPNIKDGDDYSPLWIAVSENNIKIAPLLLSYGGDVNFTSVTLNVSLLYTAVVNNSENMVKILLENGADVNVSTLLGATPLHHAIQKQNITIARILLAKNCDFVKFTDFDGDCISYDAFDLALSNGDSDMIKLLMRMGCPVDEAFIKVNQLPKPVRDDEELVEWMYNYFYNPQSLLHTCRVQLRSTYQTRISEVVDVLRNEGYIPSRLADKILMKDILEEEANCIINLTPKKVYPRPNYLLKVVDLR